jgi:PilZ domain-containing protein
MDRLVFYSEGLEPEIIKAAVTDVDVLAVYSQRRLIEALVDEPALVGAVIHITELNASWSTFLDSVSRTFARLPVLVVRGDGSGDCPDGFSCMTDDASDEVIREALDTLVGAVPERERRQHHRFEWPLRGVLTGGDGSTHRISEISAGGAYLEPVGSMPGSGEQCGMEIHFQNFKMLANCAILDPRHTSSHKSAGFGVRFVDLSDEATAFIGRIVQDALIAILVDPTATPPVPTIDEEEDVLSIGCEFTLT